MSTMAANLAGTMSALATVGSLQVGSVRHSLTGRNMGKGGAGVATTSAMAGSSVRCSALQDLGIHQKTNTTVETLRNVACTLCAALTVATALPSFAAQNAGVRLPPLSRDPTRCEKAFIGNTIGQANGVANSVLDLRFCDFSNDKINLKGKTLSAALMVDAKFDGADMTEVIMSKAYAVGASFKGTNFTNAVVDRVAFDNSDMRGVKFNNTVLSGSTFEGANLEGADFENALIGYVDIQKLCRNSTLPEESRGTLGCK